VQVTDYGVLGAEHRLALLQGLIQVASDSEAVRGQYVDGGAEVVDDRLPRGLPIGCDDSGTCYHLLGADSGPPPSSHAPHLRHPLVPPHS